MNNNQDEDDRVYEFGEEGEPEWAPEMETAAPAAGKLRDVEKMYLRDIRMQPHLSNEETLQLIREIRALERDPANQEEADAKRHRIINANMRLVATLAMRKFLGRGVELVDLLSEGSFAISIAIDKFDLERDVQFSTCLYYWIMQKLQLATIQYGSDIRIPTWVDVKIRQMYMCRVCLASELGIEEEQVPPAAIAAAMGKDSTGKETTEADVISLMEIYRSKTAKKIDSMVKKNHLKESDGNEDPLELQDDSLTRLEVRLLDEKQQLLLKVIELLDNPKQVEVLKMRYGFLTGKEMSQTEIGQYYESMGRKGCTRQRIQQIEKEALENLRTPYFVKKMREFGLID